MWNDALQPAHRAAADFLPVPLLPSRVPAADLRYHTGLAREGSHRPVLALPPASLLISALQTYICAFEMGFNFLLQQTRPQAGLSKRFFPLPVYRMFCHLWFKPWIRNENGGCLLALCLNQLSAEQILMTSGRHYWMSYHLWEHLRAV